MRTFAQISAIRTFVHAAKSDDKVIGFVPTMGALHDGHLSLIKKARAECDVVVASIFVNPTQFGPSEDFERYPRPIEKDSVLCQKSGVDALFLPTVAEMYPPGSQTLIDVPALASRLEGEARPGHFRGVATVCAKLFNVIQPDMAYFGRKDYQQLKVIERMAADLHLPITIVPMPIVREPDGLALSSRNQYLSPAERKAATVLNQALNAARAVYEAGERSGPAIEMRMHAIVHQEALVQTEYAFVANAESLDTADPVDGSCIALIAANIGTTRLIDNAPLG